MLEYASVLAHFNGESAESLLHLPLFLKETLAAPNQAVGRQGK